MLKFLKQYFLLSQQVVVFTLQCVPLSDILDAKQNGRVSTSLIGNWAGVQAHNAMPEVGEFMLDLIVFHRALLWNDLFQKRAKVWNIPFAVA